MFACLQIILLLYNNYNQKNYSLEDNKEKRVLRIELDNEVKKVSITGKNSDEKIVMRQDLSEDELDEAIGGGSGGGNIRCLDVQLPKYPPKP